MAGKELPTVFLHNPHNVKGKWVRKEQGSLTRAYRKADENGRAKTMEDQLFLLETLNPMTSISVGEARTVRVSVKVTGDFMVEDLRGKTCFVNKHLQLSSRHPVHNQIQVHGGWKMIHIESVVPGHDGPVAVVDLYVRNVTVKDLHLPMGMSLVTCTSFQDPTSPVKWVPTEVAGALSTSPEPAPPGEEVVTVGFNSESLLVTA